MISRKILVILELVDGTYALESPEGIGFRKGLARFSDGDVTRLRPMGIKVNSFGHVLGSVGGDADTATDFDSFELTFADIAADGDGVEFPLNGQLVNGEIFVHGLSIQDKRN